MTYVPQWESPRKTPASLLRARASNMVRTEGSASCFWRSSSGSPITSPHPGIKKSAQCVRKLMFIGTSVGMVKATMRPPALAAADEAESWCSMRSAERASTVSTFQLRGRRAVTLMVVMRSTSSGLKESRHPLVMYSSVVPSCAATSSQKASISRRSAWRELIGRPSPSEWVRDCEDEKPRPPASSDSARRVRMASISPSEATSSDRAAAHHLSPQRAVPHEKPGVDAESSVQRVEVLGEARPVPWNAILQCGERHPLDLCHHPADVVGVLRVDRRQREPAIASDHGRDAVHVGGGGERIPEELCVVMRVGVDHPGGHHEAGGVEFRGGLLFDLADGHDAALPYPDVRDAAGLPGAVDERAGSDDVVEHGTSGGGHSAGAPGGQDLTTRQLTVAARPRIPKPLVGGLHGRDGVGGAGGCRAEPAPGRHFGAVRADNGGHEPLRSATAGEAFGTAGQNRASSICGCPIVANPHCRSARAFLFGSPCG